MLSVHVSIPFGQPVCLSGSTARSICHLHHNEIFRLFWRPTVIADLHNVPWTANFSHAGIYEFESPPDVGVSVLLTIKGFTIAEIIRLPRRQATYFPVPLHRGAHV